MSNACNLLPELLLSFSGAFVVQCVVDLLSLLCMRFQNTDVNNKNLFIIIFYNQTRGSQALKRKKKIQKKKTIDFLPFTYLSHVSIALYSMRKNTFLFIMSLLSTPIEMARFYSIFRFLVLSSSFCTGKRTTAMKIEQTKRNPAKEISVTTTTMTTHSLIFKYTQTAFDYSFLRLGFSFCPVVFECK